MNGVKYRNIALFLLLSFLTCGIYSVVALCIMSNEINETCEGDGKHTTFFLWAVLLGVVTLGIYPIIWYYKAIERLRDNGYRYGITVKHSGGEFLLWLFLGAIIVVGPFVAICYFVSDLNQFSEYVGVIQPKRYSANPIERLQIEKEPFQGIDITSDYIDNGGYVQNDDSAVDLEGTVSMTNTGNIMWLNGDYAGYTFPIEADKETVIGKDASKCNIVIDLKETTVSRKHVGIKFDPINGLYIVTDYSLNGTYIDDGYQTQRVEAGNPTYIQRGKIVSIGNGENSFRLV